jgi:23S rRNA pseudouridine1911/1915/1917 synthase
VATPNTAVTVPLLADTPDYIVLNKPAGLVVHQAPAHPAADTLVNGLLAMFPALAGVGDDLIRPGIVQRLDQFVSGVMVVAKTPAMFEHLKSQFQAHRVYKRYLALAHGKFSQPGGEIRFSIARSERTFTKMAARPDASGKAAITKYTVLKQYQRYTFLELEISTGRTHQIRVHLNALGHPLVGETVYVPKNFHSRLQPGRLFLHAADLRFTLPNGEIVQYSAPLPQALQAILDGF